MSKWLEKQLKYNSQVMVPKTGVYTVRTNNITLQNLLNRPDYSKEIQSDIAITKEINQDFGAFLIKELSKEYKRIMGRESEWSVSWHSPGIEGDCSGCIYLYPTDKEINFKLKTKKWGWSQELEGMGVQTTKGWWHISYFSPKGWNPRVFIRVKKLSGGLEKK
jgi:hypothetical protein